MEIPTYLRQVSLSDKAGSDNPGVRVLFLGLIGEIGSLLSECKKTLREGRENRSKVEEKLIQEMGDSLWYISAITLRHELNLRTDVINANIERITNHESCSSETKVKICETLDSLPNRLPLNFNEYQNIAWMTAASELRNSDDELLARLIKNASHLMRYIANKGLSDQDEKRNRLEVLLGDVLWYIAVFAKKNSISLNDVAQSNYNKTVGRWRLAESKPTNRLDSRDSHEEKLPNEMSFLFKPTDKDHVEIFFEDQNIIIGDPLNDNIEVNDGYRYHDAFHMAFAAILTWSPVLRKLLRLGQGRDLNKGKNFHRFRSIKDNTQDGARAQIVEEAIAKIVHSHAEDVDPERLLADKMVVGTEILDQIKVFTRNLEVHIVNQWEWEVAIIEACKIYALLKENNGGRVKLNLKDRNISFEPI